MMNTSEEVNEIVFPTPNKVTLSIGHRRKFPNGQTVKATKLEASLAVAQYTETYKRGDLQDQGSSPLWSRDH